MSSTETSRYHLTQYDKPYDSTIALERFIRATCTPAGIFMDVGCGAGAVLRYFGDVGLTAGCKDVIGIDFDLNLLVTAQQHNPGMTFLQHDFNHPLPACDISISVQVLSFIEDWRKPLEQQLRATRHWAFFTSLFWRGVSTHTHASDKEKRDAHYNVIEEGAFEEVAKAVGAQGMVWHPYKPARPFWAPPGVLRSRVEDGRTYSGPLLLPWEMVAVKMNDPG